MPMFPLGTVLFPGATLPLHVFEPRYRQMIGDCLATPEPEFGIALITRGSEVGGGDERSSVATVARLVQAAQFEDGRYALVTVGARRVRVNAWLADDPYPRADVDDWPDDVTGDSTMLAESLTGTLARVRRLNALSAEIDGNSADLSAQLSHDVVLASFQLCARAPVGPADQQRLLMAAGVGERLQLLNVALDDAEALLQFRLQHESGGGMATDVGGP
jgi:Lon protease-like protein